VSAIDNEPLDSPVQSHAAAATHFRAQVVHMPAIKLYTTVFVKNCESESGRIQTGCEHIFFGLYPEPGFQK
jgi:hypothetical protein